MKHPIAKFAVNVILVLVSSVVALIIFEFALRELVPVYNPVGRVEYRCIDGAYRGIANTQSRQWTNTGEFDVSVDINKYGFRDNKDLAQSSKSDIFVVGDSFSFGQGVEQNQRYSDILARITGASVFNISIPNNLDGYYRLLNYSRSKGAGVRNVIVGVSMENDLALYPDEISRCQSTDSSRWKESILNPGSISLRGIKQVLNANFALYSFVSAQVQQSPSFRKIAMDLGMVSENTMFTGLGEFNEVVLKVTANRLEKISKEYDLVILIIPSRGLWQGARIEEQIRIHNRFIRLLKKKRLNVVDLKPVFEQSGNPLGYHFAVEGHWNVAGHKLAADTLAGNLRSTRIVNQD